MEEIRLRLLKFKSIQEFNKKHGNNHDNFIYSKNAYKKLIHCILPSVQIGQNMISLPCKSPYQNDDSPSTNVYTLNDESVVCDILREANFQTLLPIYKKLLSQNKHV